MIDDRTHREYPDHLRCSCRMVQHHSYWCPVLNWLQLNPPPRAVCPTCPGRGSIIDPAQTRIEGLHAN